MRTKPTPGEPLGPCLICGAPATELHHIIPRGHIGGRAAENWSLNMAPLCHPCHMRGHLEGWSYEGLWERMGYSASDLVVLAALGAHPSATRYPLVRRRAEWAGRELRLRRAWGQGVPGPVPGWIER
jgi:hypothetical protein